MQCDFAISHAILRFRMRRRATSCDFQVEKRESRTRKGHQEFLIFEKNVEEQYFFGGGVRSGRNTATGDGQTIQFSIKIFR